MGSQPCTDALQNGQYVIYHVGSGANGTGGGRNCSGEIPAPPREAPPSAAGREQLAAGGVVEAGHKVRAQRSQRARVLPAAGSTVHVSSSVGGPWSPLAIPLAHPLRCTNHAPWQHPNGTLSIVCGSTDIYRAEDPAGLCTHVTTINRTAGDQLARPTVLLKDCPINTMAHQ